MSRPRRAAWRGAPLPGLPRRSRAAARRDSPEFLGVRTVCARVCVCCGAGVWAEGRAAHVSRESRLGGRFPAPARPKAPGSMSQSKAGSRALCLPPAVPTPADRGGLEAGPRARWERRLRPPRGAVDPRVGEDGSSRVRSAERGGSWAASEPEPHTPARSGSPGGAGCPLRLGGTRGAGRGVSGVVYTAGPGWRLLCGPLRAAGPAPGSAEGGNVPYCLRRESGPRSLPARNSLSTGRPVYLHHVACYGAEKASDTTLVLKGLAVWWRAKPQPRWSTPRGVRQSPGHEARAWGVADGGGGGGRQRVARDAPHRGGERARGLQGSLGATWLDAWAGFAFDTRSFE